MSLTRRDALRGGLAFSVLAAAPASASAGTRELALFRAGTRLGDKSVAVQRTGTEVSVTTRIEIVARVIGFPVYRYDLVARETWSNGSLVTLDAETSDNGTPHFVRARRAGDSLAVEGSAFSGTIGGEPATTSYWSPEFLRRKVWISTQDGRPLDVTARNLGPTDFPTLTGSVSATRWRIGGDLTDLFLYYDAAGEWVGTEFPARGEVARFVTARRGAALTPLWVDA